MRFLLASLALPLLTAASHAHASPPVPAGFRIAGTVVNVRTGAPIRRCRITAREIPAGTETGAGPRGGGGRFNGGPPGGFSGDEIVLDGPGSGSFGSERILAIPSGGGRQRGPGGRTQDEIAAVTDSTGHFTLALPAAGRYRVTATAYGFRAQSYEQHDQLFAAVVISTASPSVTLQFRLTPEALLRGFVLDEANDGVQQGQIALEQQQPATQSGQPPQWRRAGNAVTDDRGYFELPNLAPGSYRLSVTARPWYASGGVRLAQTQAQTTPSPDPSLDLVYPQTWFPAATDAAAAQVLTLGPGEEREADFHLAPEPAVHLRIPRQDAPAVDGSGRPQPTQFPRVTSDTGQYLPLQITTSSDGSWDIGGLSPGSYTVRMTGPGGDTGETSHLRIAAGGSSIVSLGASDPQVRMTAKVEGLEQPARVITLQDLATGATYQLQSTRQPGGRRRDADDDATPRPPDSWTGQVPPGSYNVLLGQQDVYLQSITGTGAHITGRRIDVSTAADADLVVHAAQGRAEIAGSVRLGDAPVAAGLVLLVPASLGSPGALQELRQAESATDGSFTLGNVIPGEYILLALNGGWTVNWRDPQTLLGYLTRGTPVKLASGQQTKVTAAAVAP